MMSPPGIALTRSTACLVAALLASAPRASAGGDTSSMCKRDEVVSFVARAVHRQNVYAELDRDSIGEIPIAAPNQALCAVNLVERNYDYRAYRVNTWLSYQEYVVRKIDYGYEVSLRP